MKNHLSTYYHNGKRFKVFKKWRFWYIDCDDGAHAMIPYNWGWDRVERTIKNW